MQMPIGLYRFLHSSLPNARMCSTVEKIVEDVTGAVGLDSCNASLYENGCNSIPWHSDNEVLFLARSAKIQYCFHEFGC